MRIELLSVAVLFFLGLFSVTPGTAEAQSSTPTQTASKASSAYALEPLVVESTDIRYHMAADGTGVCERTVSVRVQSDATLKQLSVLSIPFAAKSEHVEWVYARVRHADGSVTETPLTGAMEMVDPVTREAPFYSDLKQMQLPLRDLRVGDAIEWKAKIVRTVSEATGEFWGQESFVREGIVLSQTLELEVPKDKAVTVWSPKSKPVESVVGEERIYTWKSEQKKPTVGAEADAAKEVEKKRVRTADEELDLREGKLPDVAWTTFKSWEAVGAWYRGMEGDRMIPDADVKAKVAQITAGKTTELEKVQAVYSYVATQIHYIGVAFGIGRYQPHSAGDVLQDQYGDCKDKHTLIAAMLGALGLQPDAVLIGAGIRFNEAVPSPAAFNHLITRVQVDGKPVWLDTTSEVAPYGMLIYLIRDHDALVIPASGTAKVEKTPVRPPIDAVTTMDAVGTLDAEGKSNSKITLTFRGDEEVLVRSIVRQTSPAQYDQLAQQICGSMGYGGKASHMEVSRVEDTSEPLKISFDYEREKAGDWSNYKTIPQLAPVTLMRPDEKEPPVQAIALGVPRVEMSHSSMKLPDGWTVEFPEAVHEKSAYVTYDETYRFDKGVMYAERRIEVLKERVPVSDWKSYSKFAEKVELGDEQFIQLIRPGGKASDESASGAKPSNPEAAQLVYDAYNLIGKHELDAARAKLDRAMGINATQKSLWSTYGYLSFQRNAMDIALKDYQKELDLNPGSFGVYESLADAQLRLGKRAEAVETFKKWVSLDASNPQPSIRLGNLMMFEGKPEEAEKVAEAALASVSGEEKNERLLLLLGTAQLKAGMKEKGDGTLTKLLRETDDPDMKNDAAYELADAGLELPLAERTTRAALDSMEEQSKEWTLDESQSTLRRKTRMLEATWDTMGWVYFRNGKIPEATEYIDAAWRGRQDAEVGRHVGEIAMAKGDKDAALTDYELAKATFSSSSATGTHVEPGEREKELNARLETLLKAGAHSSVTDGRAALQKMRTVSLGPADGMSGVAEYKMLVKGDSVLKVEQTGNKSIAGAEDRLKKVKLEGFIPPHSEAQLVFVGMLNCHADTCELVLEP